MAVDPAPLAGVRHDASRALEFATPTVPAGSAAFAADKGSMGDFVQAGPHNRN